MKQWLNAPLGRFVRERENGLLAPLVSRLNYLGITPTALTIAGLIAQVVVGWLLANGYITLGAVFLLGAGLLDILDGALARLTDQTTRLGAFLDSTFDQLGDMAVFLGLLWFTLAQAQQLDVLLIFLSLFGSMVNSHIRARAGMEGLDCNTGLMTRGERYPIMVVALLLHQVTAMLWLLSFLNNFSALLRLVYVWRTSAKNNIAETKLPTA